MTDIHDGGEAPLPEPDLPTEGQPVVLTEPVEAESADGTRVMLPAGTTVTFQGDAGDGLAAVSCALIVHAYPPPSVLAQLNGEGAG